MSDVPPAPTPVPDEDEQFHCENCLYLPDPLHKGEGFWACQNLCVRD